ncbi:MAG: SRPBCC domain-containing protein [Asticcacaulis sp.]|nr:SRPBCC domain-containing protein [Asticcacaulis sp.]
MFTQTFTVGDTTVSTPSDTEIRMQRTFRAPRNLVFDCFTKPELLKRWFNCRGYSLLACEVDLRVGGHWRYVMVHPERPQMGMGGEYLEIQAPEHSVHTEAFDDFPGQSTVTGEWIGQRHGRRRQRMLRQPGQSPGRNRPGLRSTAMISSPEILDVPAQKIAKIHVTCPSSDIMKVMGPGIQELHAVLGTQGITPTGPWFTHHLKEPDGSFDFDICLPVDRDVVPQGRVETGELPAHRVARTVYTGGYEGLGNGWGQFMNWLREQKLAFAPDLWEVYTKGPESGTDSSQYQTQLNRPLN